MKECSVKYHFIYDKCNIVQKTYVEYYIGKKIVSKEEFNIASNKMRDSHYGKIIKIDNITYKLTKV